MFVSITAALHGFDSTITTGTCYRHFRVLSCSV